MKDDENMYVAFIKELRYGMKDIIFRDFNIRSSSTTKGKSCGIIGFSYATIENCEFDNIKIESNLEKVGIIAHFVDGTITDTTLKEITIIGNGTYTGGLIGYADKVSLTKKSNTHSIIINGYITIDGKSNTGGIIGYGNYISNFQGVKKSDEKSYITIRPKSTSYSYYVGGIIGYANYLSNMRDIQLNNIDIKGYQYIAGIVGYLSNGSMPLDINLTNVNNGEKNKINGSYYVGGIFGSAYYSSGSSSSINSYLKISNTQINNEKDTVGYYIGRNCRKHG